MSTMARLKEMGYTAKEAAGASQWASNLSKNHRIPSGWKVGKILSADEKLALSSLRQLEQPLNREEPGSFKVDKMIVQRGGLMRELKRQSQQRFQDKKALEAGGIGSVAFRRRQRAQRHVYQQQERRRREEFRKEELARAELFKQLKEQRRQERQLFQQARSQGFRDFLQGNPPIGPLGTVEFRRERRERREKYRISQQGVGPLGTVKFRTARRNANQKAVQKRQQDIQDYRRNRSIKNIKSIAEKNARSRMPKLKRMSKRQFKIIQGLGS